MASVLSRRVGLAANTLSINPITNLHKHADIAGAFQNGGENPRRPRKARESIDFCGGTASHHKNQLKRNLSYVTGIRQIDGGSPDYRGSANKRRGIFFGCYVARGVPRAT